MVNMMMINAAMKKDIAQVVSILDRIPPIRLSETAC